MFSQPVNLYIQEKSRYLQNYSNFLQNKIRELENRTNSVICQLAEVLFQSSQSEKNDIFDDQRQIHSSKIMSSYIQDSQQSIEILVNLIHELLSNIVSHTRIVLKVEIVKEDPPTAIKKDKNQNIRRPQPQIILNQQQKIDAPKIFNNECPICFKQIYNGLSYVKHMKLHNVYTKSQGYDCPQCQASFYQSKMLVQHLFKIHYVVEDFNLTKKKVYYCPFMKQKFTTHQTNKLIHFIRSSPLYTKAMDQIMVDRLQFESEGQGQTNIPESPTTKVEFIRGVTKGVFVHEKLYGCPLCGLQEFDTLKFLGGHIQNSHRIKFRNKLFCPHCAIEYPRPHELSTHLICFHGKVEETTLGARKLIYTTLNGESFGDFDKLRQHLMNDENYLTFFSAACKEQQINPINVQQDTKDLEE